MASKARTTKPQPIPPLPPATFTTYDPEEVLPPDARLQLRAFDPPVDSILNSYKTIHQQLQPIIVRPTPKGPQCVAGWRRTRAARQYNSEMRRIGGPLWWIEAKVMEMTDDQAAAYNLHENLADESLTAMDVAVAIRKLGQLGWSQNRIREHLGQADGGRVKTQAWISQQLDLLRASPEVRKLIAEGAIKPYAAMELVKKPEPFQNKLVARVTKPTGEFDPKAFREEMRKLRGPKPGTSEPAPKAPPLNLDNEGRTMGEWKAWLRSRLDQRLPTSLRHLHQQELAFVEGKATEQELTHAYRILVDSGARSKGAA